MKTSAKHAARNSMVLKCAAVGALVSGSAVYAGPFTAGNLVVLRVGDGVTALSSAAAAVFLDEYSVTTKTLIQSVPVPTSSSGANAALTMSGSATSEGMLTATGNGKYLTFGGYNAAPGTLAVVGTSSATVNRVIGRVSLGKTIDTSTKLSDAFSANNIRSVVSADGTTFYAAGVQSGAAVRTATLGGTTSTGVSSGGNNRVVNIFNGQLYVSSGSGATLGISPVGSGLPTSSSTQTVLPGFTETGMSPYDFAFKDASTVFLADDRATAGGGLGKWTLNNGTWSKVYSNLIPASATGGTGSSQGARALAVGPTGRLYVVTSDGKSVVADDAQTGASYENFVPNTQVTNPGLFRGIEVVPSSNQSLAITGASGSYLPTFAAYDDTTNGVTVSGFAAGENGSSGIVVLAFNGTQVGGLTTANFPNALSVLTYSGEAGFNSLLSSYSWVGTDAMAGYASYAVLTVPVQNQQMKVSYANLPANLNVARLAVIPEPAATGLLVPAALLLGARRRRA